MGTPCRLHLICGFLGAGKTTLMRRLLAAQPRDERLAVVVNEFGRLGIDGALLKGFSHQVRELTSGCICCELMTDFQAALTDMVQGFAPARILVEATGLAEAGDLLDGARLAAEAVGLNLASVATVVDTEMFTHRDMLGASYFGQIKAADLLILNKTDLVEPGAVEGLLAELRALNPRARLVPAVHCALERDLVLAPGTGPDRHAPSGLLGLEELAGRPSHDPAGDRFLGFAFRDPGRLSLPCLERFLARLPWEVFRVKGRVRADGGSRWLNYTYRRPEWSPCAEDGPTELAFVTWGVGEDELLPGLKACLEG